VRLTPLGTSATNWYIVPALRNRWVRGVWWNENWQGKPKYTEKTCPSATLSTTNHTWPDLGSNPGRRGGNPASNRLSYGAAYAEELQSLICCQKGPSMLSYNPIPAVKKNRQMKWLMTEQTAQFILLPIYIPTRDAIMASIHRNQGAVAALLADIRQQPHDVTLDTMTSLHETRYAPDHSASGKNRWMNWKCVWTISEGISYPRKNSLVSSTWSPSMVIFLYTPCKR
jgi:hypothetical protein